MKAPSPITVLGCLLLAAAIGWLALSNWSTSERRSAGTAALTFAELTNLTPKDLPAVELARMNLLCAEKLPGAEELDVGSSLHTLDHWANRVRSETARHLYRFQRNPAEFTHSEAYFRVLMLVTVLQQDFNLRYNPARITTPDAPEPDHIFFADSKDLFLHGITERTMGTCISMPVLYVAIGRRLGYPLKLVTAHDHLFARWDSPDGKFNIEASGQGLTTPDDNYYKTWPRPPSEAELRSGTFLKPLTPAEELAILLQTRGHCLRVAGRLSEARETYLHAQSLAPTRPENKMFLGLIESLLSRQSGGSGFTRNPNGDPHPILTLNQPHTSNP